jgi:hypothetical protein
MKKLIAVLFLAFAIQSHGATMFGTFTNYLGQPDTNSFLIYRLGGATARADGTWVTAGLPLRVYPQTNGYWQTNLQVGNYMATNASLAPGIVFRVPDDHGGNSYSIWSNRLSGYNTFVTLVYGDNPPPTFGQITNALNGKPVFPDELDAAILAATNGMTTIVRSNPAVFMHTNALPGLTNGFVRADITNGLAPITLLNSSSNALRTALTSTINTASNDNAALIVAATNGLARLTDTNGFVRQPNIDASSNSLRGALVTIINTASNDNRSFTIAATNGLARTTITNGLVSHADINSASNALRSSLTSTINTSSNANRDLILAATNGLARITITNGLVSQTEINSSSNALRTSLIGTINTTSNSLWLEIGTGSGGAGTNYVDAQVAASTNTLRSSLITVINSSSNANRSFAIDTTNGLARLTDTNGFVRQANIDASSNSLRSGLVTIINSASNTARSFSIDTTNGLRQALSSAMTVTNLSFSGNPFMRRDTNIVAVYGAGNTTNNGTYVWESGLYRKTVGPGSIYFINPTWFMEDGSATIYSAQNPIGPWTVVSGSGPAPTSDYGHYVDLNGAVFRGTFVSTNFFYAVTNGFQSATNYARSATNVLNSNLTALINTASNANHEFAVSVTNGLGIDFVTTVNTASNAIRTDLAQKVVTTNVTIGSDLVLEQNTNVLSITGAGTATANGTYVWNSTGKVFTNTHTGSYVTNNSGDYVIRSVANASLYSSSTLITNNYTLGSGDSPSPNVVYGQRLDLSGMEFYGAIHSTNLDARLAEGVANAAALGNIPASEYITNGGVANVTSTNATHLGGASASTYAKTNAPTIHNPTLIGGNVFAPSIVVDPIHGSDVAGARWGRAFQTISNAVAILTNNDTVLIKSTGTNVIWAVTNTLGTVHLSYVTNVTFVGEPGNYISMPNTSANWGKGITFIGCKNLRFTGLNFYGDRSGETFGHVVGAICSAGGASATNGRSIHVEIDNCKFIDMPDQAITHVPGLNGSAQSVDSLWVHHNYFENIGCINNCVVWGYDGDCISGLMGHNFIAEHNIANGVQGFIEYGFGGESGADCGFKTNFTARFNFVDNVRQRGILVGGVDTNGGYTGINIVGNSLRYAPTNEVHRVTGPAVNACIAVYGGRQVVVKDNIVAHWPGPNTAPIHVAADHQHIDFAVIDGNEVRFSAGPSIWVGILNDSDPYTNIVSVVKNNRIYTATTTAPALYAASRRLFIEHNYFNLSSGDTADSVIRLFNGSNGGVNGTTTTIWLKRNIIDGVQSAGKHLTIPIGAMNMVWEDNEFITPIQWTPTTTTIYGATWTTHRTTFSWPSSPTNNIWGSAGSLYRNTLTGEIFKYTNSTPGNTGWVPL